MDNFWTFILADVTQPILGADLFRDQRIAIDIHGRRIFDIDTYASVPVRHTNAATLGLHSLATADKEYTRLLAEFPALSIPNFSAAGSKHGVEHFITTQGAPAHSRARRLSPDKLVIARREFKNMEKLGIIRHSCSAWSSSLQNQSRRNNLRVDGVKEKAGETWEETEASLRQVFQRELQIPQQQVDALRIERAHRTGAADTQRDRTIVVKFDCFKDRDAILRAARTVKPRGTYLNEDYSQRVVARRKELIPSMKDARERGKIAYLSFDKLVVKDRQAH